jgi:predicted nucleic acid-binding protein
MIVVADSGPLINLSRVHRLELLRDLYGEILVPAQVHEEVVVHGRGLAGSTEVAAATWCRVIQPVIDIDAVRPTYPQLGAGELAAIFNALGQKADLLLCDDLAARRVAEGLGQRVRGTLGVLVEAKQRSLLPRVAQVIEELLRAGAWLNPAVAREALRLAGELP